MQHRPLNQTRDDAAAQHSSTLLGNPLIRSLAENQARRLIPLSCLHSKSEAIASSLAQRLGTRGNG